MILVIVAVHDAAAGLFGVPSFVTSVGGAVRSFGDQVNDPTTQFGKHPEDYTLHEVGTYNDNTCTFDLKDRPEQIAAGRNLKR